MAKNEVRIISGKWKGRKLRFADRPNLRPTLGRARETLFNWLGPSLPGSSCLDLFAGSGALGLEAASRGAANTVLVDNDAQTTRALKAAVEALNDPSVQVVRAEAQAFLRGNKALWDVIFVDPPFSSELLDQTLARLAPHLAADGYVYWEAATPIKVPEGFSSAKQQRAGDSHFGLLRFDALP